jgi:IS5 family transposase
VVGLSYLAMKEALFETAPYREFADLSSLERIPDRVSILRFRHLLEEHHLAAPIVTSGACFTVALVFTKARPTRFLHNSPLGSG